MSGSSVTWLTLLPWEQETSSSNLDFPTKIFLTSNRDPRMIFTSSTRKGEAVEWIETPESSRILRIRYNEGEENTVDVEFSSHEIYRYFDVPLKVWDEFVANPSKGRYVNVGLRPFRYKKIQPTPKAEPQQQPPPEE